MKLAAPFFILTFALGAKTAVAAQASVCPPYTRPIVLDFQTQMPSPTYNHNLNIAGIRNLSRMRGQPSGGPHSRALGITAIETALSLRAASRLVPQQDGYCVYLTSVDAEFGWTRLDVQVAAELKEGGCAYRAVLDHENQHVAINRNTVREYAPRIRAKIEELLSGQPAIFTRDSSGTTDAILEQIKDHAAMVIDQFSATLGQRQAVIDTAKNYSATSALCRDWGGTLK